MLEEISIALHDGGEEDLVGVFILHICHSLGNNSDGKKKRRRHRTCEFDASHLISLYPRIHKFYPNGSGGLEAHRLLLLCEMSWTNI